MGVVQHLVMLFGFSLIGAVSGYEVSGAVSGTVSDWCPLRTKGFPVSTWNANGLWSMSGWKQRPLWTLVLRGVDYTGYLDSVDYTGRLYLGTSDLWPFEGAPMSWGGHQDPHWIIYDHPGADPHLKGKRLMPIGLSNITKDYRILARCVSNACKHAASSWNPVRIPDDEQWEVATEEGFVPLGGTPRVECCPRTAKAEKCIRDMSDATCADYEFIRCGESRNCLWYERTGIYGEVRMNHEMNHWYETDGCLPY